MANPEHLTLVRKAEDWATWRNEHPDVTPDLREADLGGANLTGAQLVGTDLSWANLRRATLIEYFFPE